MTLFFLNDGSVKGKYYYNKYKTDIQLCGKVNGQEISLTVTDDNNNPKEIFNGHFSPSPTVDNPSSWHNKAYNISGTWEHNNKKLPFKLAVDPLADKNLSCAEMKSFPELIFGTRFGVDLGSGNLSPNNVDYYCEGSLSSLPFLSDILSFSEKIRSDGPQHICTGSSTHAYWRYYHFDLLKAGLAPDINTRQSKKWDERARTYRRYDNQLNYFELWAHQSLYNFDLYISFWESYNEAFPVLTNHYETKFGVNKEQASEYAEYALRHFIVRAAGSFYYNLQNGEPKIPYLSNLLKKKPVDTDLIKKTLTRSSQEEIDQALKSAILYQSNLDIITLLIDNGANVNSGDETALFFALRDIKLVKLLLSYGAKINHENGFGKTALYYAIENNDYELTKLLLQKGSNINHTYKTKVELDKIKWSWEGKPFYQSYCLIKHTKRTPLMHAAQHSDVKMIKLLLSHGAEISAVDETGATVLNFATMGKNKENISFLKSKIINTVSQ